jgi:hypothetical protein
VAGGVQQRGHRAGPAAGRPAGCPAAGPGCGQAQHRALQRRAAAAGEEEALPGGHRLVQRPRCQAAAAPCMHCPVVGPGWAREPPGRLPGQAAAQAPRRCSLRCAGRPPHGGASSRPAQPAALPCASAGGGSPTWPACTAYTASGPVVGMLAAAACGQLPRRTCLAAGNTLVSIAAATCAMRRAYAALHGCRWAAADAPTCDPVASARVGARAAVLLLPAEGERSGEDSTADSGSRLLSGGRVWCACNAWQAGQAAAGAHMEPGLHAREHGEQVVGHL